MNNLRVFKFWPALAVLSLLLIFSSCGKDDPEKLTLTGTWEGTMTIEGDTYNGTMTLVQNDTGGLTGSFVFSDNSYYSSVSLLPTSKITGNSVIIEWILQLDWVLNYSGTVSSDYNSMSGNITSYNGFDLGTWSATRKIQQKSAIY